jgi:hypothetical protein
MFFAEYVDLWSMGDLFRRYLAPPEGEGLVEICSGSLELACYPVLDQRGLLSRLRDSHERCSAEEERLFCVTLIEAVRSWELLVETATLISLRQVLDASVTDEEVIASMASSPGWLIGIDST